MKDKLLALVAGLVFGIGLTLSGMVNPAKVLGFLDLAGLWDPSLALVMAGAIGVALPAFRLAGRLPLSLLGNPIQMPGNTRIDRRLVAGSLLFGAGWGVAGICPGPALVLLGMGSAKGGVFVLAMLGGMGIFQLMQRSGGTRTDKLL